jgi:hypothetical protein
VHGAEARAASRKRPLKEKQLSPVREVREQLSELYFLY